MERLECSIIDCARVIQEPFRFDAEYYSKRNIQLEDLIKSTSGKTIDELNGVADCSAFYPSITGDYSYDKSLVPFIRVNEIQNGLVILTDETVYLPQKVLDDNANTISKAYPGDVVIAKGGNTLAKVGLVTDEYPVYATCRDVIILRTEGIKEINRYYLWAFLHSRYGYSLMWRSASQTGQPHITLPIISNMHIPLLEKKVQEKAKKLYQESVEKQKESIDKFAEAEEVLHNVMKVVDTQSICELPVISTLSEVLNYGRIDAEYHQIKYKKIKESIEKKEYFNLTDENIIDQNYYPEKDTVCRYIELSNVGYKGVVTGCTEANGQDLPSRARRKVKTGDIIISSIEGSLDKCALIDENYNEAYCSNGFYVIRTEKLTPEVLLVVMKSSEIQHLLKKACSGTILAAYSKDELKLIPLPTIDEITQNIMTKLVRESIMLYKQSVDLLEQTKKLIEEKMNSMTK